MLAWGPAAIQHTLRPLTQSVAQQGRSLGFIVPSSHCAHIVGLTWPPADASLGGGGSAAA